MGHEEEERYRMFNPHPAQGLDIEAARRRVLAHPEVMPPHPEPVRFAEWEVRERRGFRFGGLVAALAIGALAPVLLRMARKWATPRGAWPVYRTRHGSTLFVERRGMIPRRRRVLLLARR